MEGRSTSYSTTQQYRTIVTDMISEGDRAKLLVSLSTIRNGAQAKREASSKGLAYTPIDPMGRVGVLKWRGIEVALIFQRDTCKPTTVDAQMETLVAKPIQDADDAWLFVNLLNVGQHTIIPELQSKLAAAEATIKQLQGLVANMQVSVDGSIDPELYEALKRERDVETVKANKYFRALQRVDPALAKKLEGTKARPRFNRPGASESQQVKIDRKRAKEEKLKFERAVREAAKEMIEQQKRREERAAKKAAKAAAAAKATKTTTAKSGKPQAGAKTSTKKSKRP